MYCYDAGSSGAVCLDGSNGAPRDYKYRVKVISAGVEEQHPTRGYWDNFGGNAADLYVYIQIAGATLDTLPSIDNQNKVVWNKEFPNLYTANQISSMTISLYDDDTGPDELIATGEGIKITKAVGETVTYTNSNVGLISMVIQVIGVPQ